MIDPRPHIALKRLEEIDPAKGTWDILKQLKDDAKTATDTGLVMLGALVICSTDRPLRPACIDQLSDRTSMPATQLLCARQ